VAAPGLNGAAEAGPKGGEEAKGLEGAVVVDEVDDDSDDAWDVDESHNVVTLGDMHVVKELQIANQVRPLAFPWACRRSPACSRTLYVLDCKLGGYLTLKVECPAAAVQVSHSKVGNTVVMSVLWCDRTCERG
jgi:hypothetical protein